MEGVEKQATGWNRTNVPHGGGGGGGIIYLRCQKM